MNLYEVVDRIVSLYVDLQQTHMRLCVCVRCDTLHFILSIAYRSQFSKQTEKENHKSFWRCTLYYNDTVVTGIVVFRRCHRQIKWKHRENIVFDVDRNSQHKLSTMNAVIELIREGRFEEMKFCGMYLAWVAVTMRIISAGRILRNAMMLFHLVIETFVIRRK